MAKEIFAIPASFVVVELVFSIGGCVLHDKRNKLSAKNMEATLLLDDWAEADMRKQELDWDTRVENDGKEFTDDEVVGPGSGARWAASTTELNRYLDKRTMWNLIAQLIVDMLENQFKFENSNFKRSKRA